MDSLEGKLVGCIIPWHEPAGFVHTKQSLTCCFCARLQYALYKKMTQAAILIQSKFRSYHEQKKFQQSRRAAVLIQQYYRSYKEFGRLKPHQRGAAAALVQHKLR